MVLTQNGHEYPETELDQPKISLFASSIRPHLWEALFKSLYKTTINFEIIFAGNNNFKDFGCKDDAGIIFEKPLYIDIDRNISNFKYIRTANIKPAQVYEVARRHCTGELIMWIADDCEFPDDVLGKAYRFYKENCGRKDVLCMRTRENYGTWIECDNTQHQFFGNCPEAPKMAPIGMMNRKYFQELGGIDRRYICGQWDNSLMIQIYNDGGGLKYFGEGVIELDHKNKHDPKFGISGERPFGKGYLHDRKILEGSWGKQGQMKYAIPYQRYDAGFEPYEDKDLLTKSQSFNMPELWPK